MKLAILSVLAMGGLALFSGCKKDTATNPITPAPTCKMSKWITTSGVNEYEFDNTGLLIKNTSKDASGTINGYSTYMYSNGKLIKIQGFDKSGTMTEYTEGMYVADNLSEVSTYNKDSSGTFKPTSKKTYEEYINTRPMLNKIYGLKNGQLVENGSFKMEYDLQGNIVKVYSYPVGSSTYNAYYIYTYDDKPNFQKNIMLTFSPIQSANNMTLLQQFDSAGKEVYRQSYQYEYDNQGKVTKQTAITSAGNWPGTVEYLCK